MITFKQHLQESQEINLAMKAYKQLSWRARDAVDRWESTQWHDGVLQRAYRDGEHSEIREEIEAVMDPIRQTLRKVYGNNVKLYRGLYRGSSYGNQRSVALTSWTTDKRVAELFANLRGSINNLDKSSRIVDVISEPELQKRVDQYKRTGYVTWGNFRYIRSKTNPDYYNIYQGRFREFVTDGTHADFEKDQRRRRQERIDQNNENLKKAEIIERNIPVEKIVWITNELKCKEFIVLHA